MMKNLKVYFNDGPSDIYRIELAEEMTNCSRMPVAYLVPHRDALERAKLFAAAPALVKAVLEYLDARHMTARIRARKKIREVLAQAGRSS